MSFEEEKPKKYLNLEAGIEKIKRYCAYQERCHSQVRTKCIQLGVYGMQLEETISAMIQEGYLNEERFAIAFARGKQRIKYWGRIKISLELQKLQISPYCIHEAIDQLDEDDYMKGLKHIILKAKKMGKKTEFEQVKYAYSYGYEPEIIKQVLKKSAST